MFKPGDKVILDKPDPKLRWWGIPTRWHGQIYEIMPCLYGNVLITNAELKKDKSDCGCGYWHVTTAMLTPVGGPW